MSPRNGQRETKDGLDWIYRDPPGAWVLVQPGLPLQARSKDLTAALADDDEQ